MNYFNVGDIIVAVNSNCGLSVGNTYMVKSTDGSSRVCIENQYGVFTNNYFMLKSVYDELPLKIGDGVIMLDNIETIDETVDRRYRVGVCGNMATFQGKTVTITSFAKVVDNTDVCSVYINNTYLYNYSYKFFRSAITEDSVCSICGKHTEDLHMFGKDICCKECSDVRFVSTLTGVVHPKTELYVVDDTVTPNVVLFPTHMCTKEEYESMDKCYLCGKPVFNSGEDIGNGQHICGKHSLEGVNDYHNSKTIVKVGRPENKLYYGFELEVSTGGNEKFRSFDTIAGIVRSKMGKYVYDIQEDGSVDDGFEIISQPLDEETIRGEEFKTVMTDVMTFLKERKFQMHGYDCGLHIHVSKEPLRVANTDYYSDMFYMAEAFKKDCSEFGARLNNSYANYASEKDIFRNTLSLSNIKAVCDRYSTEKYMAVNNGKRATVEFRSFESTLDFNTLFNDLCIVMGISKCALTREYSKKSFKDVTGLDSRINTKLSDIDAELKREKMYQLQSDRIYAQLVTKLGLDIKDRLKYMKDAVYKSIEERSEMMEGDVVLGTNLSTIYNRLRNKEYGMLNINALENIISTITSSSRTGTGNRAVIYAKERLLTGKLR